MTASPDPRRPRTPWITGRNLAVAGIALLLGATLGTFAARRLRRADAPPSGTPGAMPPSVAIGGGAPITPAQLKHMADKQAEPLLAQLKSTPNDPQLLGKIGRVYYLAQNYREASEYYTRSLSLKDDASVRTELGRACFYAGDADRALAEFEKVLQSDPRNANALFNIGIVKWRSKSDASGAIAAWQQLLKIDPHHPRRAEVERLIERVKQQGAK